MVKNSENPGRLGRPNLQEVSGKESELVSRRSLVLRRVQPVISRLMLLNSMGRFEDHWWSRGGCAVAPVDVGGDAVAGV